MGTEVVEVSRLGLSEAAALKGVSRQAMWDAIQSGRVNAVQLPGSEEWTRGAWVVYLDEKWDAWRARPNIRRKVAKS